MFFPNVLIVVIMTEGDPAISHELTLNSESPNVTSKTLYTWLHYNLYIAKHTGLEVMKWTIYEERTPNANLR